MSLTSDQIMLAIWIIGLVAFIVIEAMTVQLVTIWFAAGSLAALIANICNASIGLQWVLFIVVSLVALAVTRPFVKRLTTRRLQPTNADRYVGEQGIVIEAIDNTCGTGQVKVKGSIWTARSQDGSVIEKDTSIQVEKIDGVKLMVTRR